MSKKAKVVVIGDGACGKTCLSVSFSQNKFPENHVPTVYDTYMKSVRVEDDEVELTIWDTAGEEDYDRLRPLSYSKSNVFIICFAIDNLESLKNVSEKWAPEVKHFCRNAPLILVGNKLDLRTGNKTGVNYEEGMKMAKKIKAREYIECSAKNMMRVQDVFLKASQISLQTETKKEKICKCISFC